MIIDNFRGLGYKGGLPSWIECAGGFGTLPVSGEDQTFVQGESYKETHVLRA